MLKKILYFSLLIFILAYFYLIFDYYYSKNNIKQISLNRLNYDEVLKTSKKNLSFLKNDTDNVINFNSGYNINEKKKIKRKFWELIKIK